MRKILECSKKILIMILVMAMALSGVMFNQKEVKADDEFVNLYLSSTNKTFTKKLSYAASKYKVTGVTGNTGDNSTTGNTLTIKGTYYTLKISTNSDKESSTLTITWKSGKGGGDKIYIKKKSNSTVLRKYNVHTYSDATSITATNTNVASTTDLYMWTGTSITYNASASPSTAYQKFIWTSGNTSYLTVSNSGECASNILKAGANPGNTTVKITTVTGYGKSVSKTINVHIRKKPTVSLTVDSDKLGVGNSKNVTATVGNVDAYTIIKSSVFSVNDPNVLTTKATGYNCTITGKSAGKSTLSFVLNDEVSQNRKDLKDTIKTSKTFTVLSTGGVIINSNDYGILNDSTITMKQGESITINPTTNNSSIAVNVKSSDTKIATVSGKTIKIVGGGTVTITCTSTAGDSAKFYIKATAEISKITMDVSEISIYKGDSENIDYSYYPTANVDTSTLVFISSNPFVADVDSTGKVTGKSAGTATITLSVRGTAVSESVTVTVKPVVESVSSSLGNSYKMVVGSTKSLDISVTPNTSSYSVAVSSSDSSVCQVINGTTIQAKKTGKATITIKATCVSGITKTKTIPVSVHNKVITSVKTKVSGKKIKVTWSASAEAKSYDVYRKEGSGSYRKVATVKKNTYKDKNVKVGKKYYYKITSVPSNGTTYASDYSAEKSIKMKIVKPRVSRVKKKGNGRYTVSIKGAKHSGFIIYVGTTKANSKKESKIYSTISGKKATISLKKGKTYYIRVKAYYSNGNNFIYSKISKPFKYKAK